MKDTDNKIRDSRKKKRGLLFNTTMSLLSSLGIIIIGVIVIAASYFVNIYNNIGQGQDYDKSNSNLNIDPMFNSADSGGNILSEKVTNILLLGVDARVQTQRSRSDSMIVLSVNWQNHKVKATSFMRDTYVTIQKPKSDGGYTEVKDKLCHAHAWGGPELTIKTINANFNLNITDYVEVNFNGLEEIVNILGGVEVEVKSGWVNEINKYIKEYARINGLNPELLSGSGTVNLTGMQAVSFARIRKGAGDDMGRTERQRTVLEKLFTKLVKTSAVNYPSILDKIAPYLTMSLKAKDILSYATKFVSTDSSIEFEQARFPMNKDFKPSSGQTINGVWYLTYDEEETKRKVFDFIFNDIDPEQNDKPADTEQTESEAA